MAEKRALPLLSSFLERAWLEIGFEAAGLDENNRRLTITLAVLSPEKHHDQHFVRTVVTRLHAWVKTIAAEGVTFTRHYLHTDGCKG